MILLQESIIVGLFTVIITLFLSFLPILTEKKQLYFILFMFILGNIKHALGYILGLQTLYCNQGYQCKQIHKNDIKIKKWISKPPTFLENILEGFIFVFIGVILKKCFLINNIYYIAFLTGFLLHFIADLIGLHIFFCKYYCI